MYYSNNILSQKVIHNIRRSPNMYVCFYTLVCYFFDDMISFSLFILLFFICHVVYIDEYTLSKDSKEFDVKLKIGICIEH